MGNGPGGLSDYDELFDRYPRLMGGPIWEWVDHGLQRRDANGTLFYGYGGDFGEEFHDGTFIADGLLLPDRTPSPAMGEVKAVFSLIRLDAVADGTALVIRNRYCFRDTSLISFVWSIHHGDRELASGEIMDPRLAPGESVTIVPPVEFALPPADHSPVWWTVRVVQTTAHELDRPWMTEPFELARGQLMLQAAAPVPRTDGTATQLADGSFAAGPATFDRFGKLTELAGRSVTQFRVDAWRAPTDNDGGGEFWDADPIAVQWRALGLHLLTERIESAEISDSGELVVTARTAGPASLNGFATTHRWRPVAGYPQAVDLVVDIVPQGRWPKSLARLGVLASIAEDNANQVAVDWHGLGPEESYADSKKAALGGAWKHTVKQWQTRYTHPQENGARRGVTHAELAFPDGGKLSIDAGRITVGHRVQQGFELSLRPWSDRALEQAKHPDELVADGDLWLHIDAAQDGVGSAACGPGVLPNAQLHAAPVSMHIRFIS